MTRWPTLEAELEQLEQTDPAVAASKAKLDAVSAAICAGPAPRAVFGGGTCVHDFRCVNCGGDVAILEAKVVKLDRAAREALGYLVNGQRTDAERTLRDAIDSLPTSASRRGVTSR